MDAALAAAAPGATLTTPAGSRDLRAAAVAAGWLPLGLALDLGATAPRQWAVGAATWLVLVALLAGEDRATRAQVAVAVTLATGLEYLLSVVLGFYDYRLHNVPAYVPPGHGLVYLAAIALARRAAALPAPRPLAALALASGGLWTLWGLTGADRPDVLGAVLYAVFAAFVLAGRTPLVYAAAFAVTAALELLGTAAGAWTWAPRDPTGYLPAGNPPSGVAGAYCVLDALALAGGPMALRALDRSRDRLAGWRLAAAAAGAVSARWRPPRRRARRPAPR